MKPESKPPTAERVHTDESLRLEREKADGVLGEKQSALEETADDVISKARARADEVLAAARARTDRQTSTHNAQSTKTTERKRAQEDDAVREERADADEVVRLERAEHIALLSVERDETDKDLSVERARSDNAVATRDEFLGIVSHDLRNMLGAIVGFAALIAKAEARDEHGAEVLAYVQRIHRSGARMDRLIGDLVDLASIEAGALTVTREVGDPAHVVREAVDTFQNQASARGVSLVAELAPAASLVAFDPARILQVLTNLLSNAIKFTPANGRVVVRLERVANELRFAVSDTGMGIPAEKLETVFERFRQVTTNDRRGVGLGLYISKCIVHGHGGRIWAESKIGAGSTFYFGLPTDVAH
ncbi:MAG TPA: HAMP domain-containing sensor histidine kinase [Polyangiaceae bacterium]|jgi:signal transduction histidine kinase|nr:HAMP domain-containing sensor histidine kinase [Polyangiaceae bacterium]